jgi:hypothetical protein
MYPGRVAGMRRMDARQIAFASMSGLSVTRREALVILTILGLVGAGALLLPALAVDEGSWRATGPLNVPRLQATGTLLDTGKVLVAGGG